MYKAGLFSDVSLETKRFRTTVLKSVAFTEGSFGGKFVCTCGVMKLPTVTIK